MIINLKAKATLQDASSTDKLSLQDLVCHSLFQQIEARINNVPIFDHARLYPF